MQYEAAGQEETSGVARGPVGEAHLQAVLGQLVRVRGADALVAGDGGVHDLADNVLVGEAHHQPVLGRAVLVLVLARQLEALAVVRLAIAAALVLDLVPLEVRLVLHNLAEHLRAFAKQSVSA